MANTSSSTFLKRARLEAERYGADPWVFVRELLQNARDAGAHRVWLETSRGNGRERICCRDDGSGMDFEHAQRYLFSLYASSKRGRSQSAGKFGIGFWSVLRFKPDEIVIRSRTHRGEAWEVRLDNRLDGARGEKTIIQRGTEIVLERPASTEGLEQQVVCAILRDAPFLHCRHRAEHPIEVRVDGRLVRAEPALPPPSLSFRRRGLRGVVGLGPEPKAEVFAHGLRVRDAPTLDELLVETRTDRQALGGCFEGLAPRVVIDSRELEVLMARGDAREDRALRRLVAVGQRELRRLVRAELDRHAGLSPFRKVTEYAREFWSASKVVRIVAAGVMAAVVGALAWFGASWLWPTQIQSPNAGRDSRPVAEPSLSPYRDIRNRYRGPDVDSLGRVGAAVDLRYRPADDLRYFAALWISGISADGGFMPESQELIGPYEGVPCAGGCLEIDLALDAPEGLVCLPIATGHVIDPLSVELEGQLQPIVALATGQPAIQLDRPRSGRLSYRSAPSSAEQIEKPRWPELPAEVVEFVRGIAELGPEAQAAAVTEFVSRRVAYDTSDEIVAAHRRAKRRSTDLFARAMAIGAGDCDVQNSLIAAMLDHAGVPSRLAVGWIGFEGRARSGLHAWAEYRGEDGRWRAVDASVGMAEPRADIVAPSLVDHWVDRERGLGLVGLAVGLPALLVIAVVVAIVRGGVWRRHLRAGSAGDILGLLRGAAVRPRAFETIHSLSSRRLLRLLDGRSASVSDARRWARKGRLASGTSRFDLARRAAQGGGAVLDLEQPEGAAVADALAAVNLDRWQRMLDAGVADELTTRVEARLRSAGEPCHIIVAELEGMEMDVLDGAGYGLGAGELWVVLDKGGSSWQSVCRVADLWPARAAFALADIVMSRVGTPQAVQQRCLSGLALDALREAAGHGT